MFWFPLSPIVFTDPAAVPFTVGPLLQGAGGGTAAPLSVELSGA